MGSREVRGLSREAFTLVVQRYEQPLYAFLLNLVHDADTARDLMQETFSDAWRAAECHKPPLTQGASAADVRHWLYQVAYHRSISWLRHQRVIHWETLESDADWHYERAEVPFEDHVAERLLLIDLLARLPALDVAVLLLTEVYEFTAAETAHITGTSSGSVAKRVSRARRKLHVAYLQAAALAEESS
jgi:RNA polymerase sigma-70 factor, ECF subfamily